MKITHVHPRAGAPWCEDQTPFGGPLTEVEVWKEIRTATMRDEGVLFPETHQFAAAEFMEELEKGRFDRELVKFLSLDPIEKTIHIPARGPIKSELVRASDGKVVGTHEVPEQPATTKKITVERYLDFSNTRNANLIAASANGTIRHVVIWEPLVDGGDLDYLHELKNVNVVVFHQVSEKCGVVVEGDVDPDDWEAEFPVMGECDLPAPEVIVDDLLIKGGVHVWAGRFESYKTMAAIELSAAILTNRKVFEHFNVRHQYPILYLSPDMGPELFQDYAKPFGLMQHAEFRWQRPGGETLHMVDSPVMGRAAKGRILILDTMLDFAKIKEAFQSGEWVEFFTKLRRLMNVCGCVAIVMLVHPTKTGAKSNAIDPSEYLKDSVTFGGKIDIGFAFSKLENTSQVFVERIKQRGFKKPLSFTIAVNNDDGDSNLDRGCFPVYLKPGEAGKKEDHVPTSGRKPNPKKDEQTQLVLQMRNEGKTFKDIAAEVGIPESTARSYYHANTWDKTKGEQ
jgi:AAA domain